MKITVNKLAIVCLVAGSIAMSCQDETKPDESKKVAEELNDDKFKTDTSEDKAQFVVDAAAGNYAEIKLAQLAIQKSTSKDIQAMAKSLEADHTAALDELKTLAASKAINIPTEEPDKTKELITDLSDDKPADFDKAWVKALMDKHEKTISSYEKELNDSKDEALKAWITKVLPIIRSHHDKLMAYNSQIKK